MEKKLEKNYSYADISKNLLGTMKRNVMDGNFDRAFGHLVDLTNEDSEKFSEFLKSPEIQKKIENRIKQITEIIKNPKEIKNPEDLAHEIGTLVCIVVQSGTMEKSGIENQIHQLKNFIEDQGINLGDFGLTR